MLLDAAEGNADDVGGEGGGVNEEGDETGEEKGESEGEDEELEGGTSPGMIQRTAWGEILAFLKLNGTEGAEKLQEL